jgi:hypothetical protein
VNNFYEKALPSRENFWVGAQTSLNPERVPPLTLNMCLEITARKGMPYLSTSN